MVSFVYKYYYYLPEQQDFIDHYTRILDGNHWRGLAPGDAEVSGGEPGYYHLDSGKLKILVVKTEAEEGFWSEGRQKLAAFEGLAILDNEKYMASTTVLAGLTSAAEEAFAQACRLVDCDDTFKIQFGSQALFRLAAWRHGHTDYLYIIDPKETKALSFVSRRLPLLQSLMVQMHYLDSLLRDRNMAINLERGELEEQLSLVLHSRLVSGHTLSATDELEQEIERLSAAYGKIVGNSRLIMDGAERMQNLIARFCHRLYADPELEDHEVIREKFTDIYRQRLEELRNTYSALAVARENYQAAIEVVRSKIDIMNSRTNMETQEQIKGLLEVNTEMQKQSLVFQYAAGLIEFIVLAYYSHTLWSHLAHAAYAVIPSSIQFIVVMALSANIVYVTHLLAEYFQGERHVLGKLAVAGAVLVLLLVFIIAGTWMTVSHGPSH